MQEARRTLRACVGPVLVATAIAACLPLAATARNDVDPAAEGFFNEARRLQDEGELAAAVAEYEAFLQRFPDSRLADEGLLNLARCHSELGDSESAEEALRALTLDRASPSSAAGFVRLAELLMDKATGHDDLKEAVRTVRRVKSVFTRREWPRLEARAEALVREGRIWLLLGETDAAAAAFVSAIEDELDSAWTARARLGLAGVLLEDGQWVAAADELQRLLTMSTELAQTERDSEAMAAARRRLALIHRFFVRPASGDRPWTATRRLAAPGVTFKKPTTVAANDRGDVVVADRQSKAAFHLAPEGAVAGRLQLQEATRPWWWAAPGRAPASAATVFYPEKSGVRTLPAIGSWTFQIIKPANASGIVPKPERVKEIVAGARGIFGEWYLLDRNTNRVLRFDSAGEFAGELTGEEPADLAVDTLGRVYVLQRRAKVVMRFGGPAGGEERVASGSWRQPAAVALDAIGRLYVLDRQQSRIDVLEPGGRRIDSIGPQLPGGTELRNPVDLAVDGSGRLYVVDSKLATVLVLE